MVTFAAIDFIMILPFAGFGLFAVVAWMVLEWLSARKSRSEERLEELRDPIARRRKGGKGPDQPKRPAAMTKMLEKASPMLAKPLKPKSEKDANKLKQRLNEAGFRVEAAPTIFLGFKTVGLFMGLSGAASTVLVQGFGMYSLLWAMCLLAGWFYLPDAVLWYLGSRRRQKIFLGLPDALDLMVVCVEAGLGLDAAMRKVSEEMKKSYRVIAEEFALCNMQLQMGKQRTEVLHALGSRNGVEDLRTLASIIIQADKFGSSIAQALRVQSDSMRTRRRQMAEEKAAKTAVKLIFPLVIFIFPGIFVILVGPAAITMVNQMLPAFQR